MKIAAKSLFFLLLSLNGYTQELSEKGFRIPLEMIANDYKLMKEIPTIDLINKHIKKVNYKIPAEDALLISEEIIKVSQCFKIDPWILTGLIQKESSFNKEAISPTGAAGLTQFTGIAFKEVHDQLGFRGREGASEAITLYFQSILKSCIDNSWIDLWNKVTLKEDHPEYTNELKNLLIKEPKISIVYGGILLKTYLAHISNKADRTDNDLELSETYFKALQLYNGEEGEAKVKYAKNIFLNLKSLYPNPISFPFLNE